MHMTDSIGATFFTLSSDERDDQGLNTRNIKQKVNKPQTAGQIGKYPA